MPDDDARVRNEASGAVTGGVVQAGLIHHVSMAGAATPRQLPPPGQLPPDVSFFTGRAGELTTLDALLDESRQDSTHAAAGTGTAVVISAIAGAGGMGKTALAVHWAHHVRDQFPDGQLYMNLRGYDPQPPLDPARALDAFLRALGTPGEVIPQEIDAMSAAYRSLLADRRILVVLDNAATPDQIRPLLPNTPTCLVVVTSRSRLSGLVARDGAHRISLDQLAPTEALSLLRNIIGPARVDAEPDAARELARRCAYLPLALRIAAERVADRPHLPITDLATDLAREHNRLDILAADDDETTAVRTVFSWSYQALPADTARVFRLLGLHPGPTISLPAAAALSGTSIDHTRRHLHTLTAGHLLAEVSRDRYQFHDLIRDYATEQAITHESDAHRAAVTRRVLVWYLHTARAADDLIAPISGMEKLASPPPPDCHPLTFTTRAEALSWCDTEYANLLAAVQLAADQGLYDLAAHLPISVSAYLTLRARWVDRIAVHTTGLISAQRMSDPHLEIEALALLGEACFDAGRFDDCDAYYQRVLVQARDIGGRRQEAGALHMLGLIHHSRGRPNEATDHFQAALSLYQDLGNHRGEALMLGNMGDVRRQQHRFDEALDNLHQSLTILQRTQNRWNEALCLRWLGWTHRDQHHLDTATDHLRRSVEAYRELDDRFEAAKTLDDLGDVLHDSGRRAEAVEVWQQALTLFEEANFPQALAVRAKLDQLPAPGRR